MFVSTCTSVLLNSLWHFKHRCFWNNKRKWRSINIDHWLSLVNPWVMLACWQNGCKWVHLLNIFMKTAVNKNALLTNVDHAFFFQRWPCGARVLTGTVLENYDNWPSCRVKKIRWLKWTLSGDWSHKTGTAVIILIINVKERLCLTKVLISIRHLVRWLFW